MGKIFIIIITLLIPDHRLYCFSNIEEKMPTGVYFYRLIVQDIMSGKKAFEKTEKMMVVK